MPDSTLQRLNQHPASRLAAQYLEHLDEPPDPRRPALLHLAVAWLERTPADQFPFGDYLVDLLELAHEMTAKGPFPATSLLVPDYETLVADLEKSPGRELLVLEGHLNSLVAPLQRARHAGRAGRLLAENLYHSLQSLFPSFGRRSG